MAHILQTLLSGHPLLSGHLGGSRSCPLNRGITVLECGRPICLSTTCMITERIRRHEVPLPNLYYFKLVKIHSRACEIAHTTSKARSPSRHDEYCLTMKEKEALSFCSWEQSRTGKSCMSLLWVNYHYFINIIFFLQDHRLHADVLWGSFLTHSFREMNAWQTNSKGRLRGG